MSAPAVFAVPVRVIRLVVVTGLATTSFVGLRAQVYVFHRLAGSSSSAGTADGQGSEARFSGPAAIGVDGAGSAYVADDGGTTIRKISPDGRVTTLAGTPGQFGNADGFRADARFEGIQGLAVTGDGIVYVTSASGGDRFSSGTAVVRQITPAGNVTTIAGGVRADALDGMGTAARFSSPEGIAVDGSGTLYVADRSVQIGAGLSSRSYRANVVRRITPTGNVITIAGMVGVSGHADGSGAAASFDGPTALALGPNHLLYVLDQTYSTVRTVTLDGVVSTAFSFTLNSATIHDYRGLAVDAAGDVFLTDVQRNLVRRRDSTEGVTDFGGPSDFQSPSGVAADSGGQVWVADTGANRIRRIGADHAIVTVAGAADSSDQRDGWGDSVHFAHPVAVAIEPDGNVLVADDGTIRRVSPIGVVTTVAGAAGAPGEVDGSGGNARLQPGRMALAADGGVYFLDRDSVRRMTPDGVVTTIAGVADAVMQSADGIGSAARFWVPSGLAVAPDGNLYVADTFNDTIRRVTPAGVVTTIAGKAAEIGYVDGSGTTARFNNPTDIAVDASGNIYVNDTRNFCIRKITPDGAVSTFAQPGLPNGYDGAGLVSDSDGSLLVGSDTLQWHRIAPDGAVSSVSLVPNSFTYPATPAAIDARGRVYVLESNALWIGDRFVVPPRLANISARALTSALEPLIAGFVVRGRSKAMLVRGIGPGLAPYGVGDAIALPTLNVVAADGTSWTNSGWSGGPDANAIATTAAQVGAFPLNAGSADAAILRSLDANSYTALVSSSAGAGVALAEVYDAEPNATDASLVNISGRAEVQGGERTLICGFVITGTSPMQVLVRGVGPALTGFGVAAPLARPRVSVYSGGTLLATNAGWNNAASASVVPFASESAGAFALPYGSPDSALVLTLQPGTYTVQITSDDGGAGSALGEVYVVSAP